MDLLEVMWLVDVFTAVDLQFLLSLQDTRDCRHLREALWTEVTDRSYIKANFFGVSIRYSAHGMDHPRRIRLYATRIVKNKIMCPS